MGSPEDEAGRRPNEGPQHEVSVDDFYLGIAEVTNSEYARFLAEAPAQTEPKFWSDERLNSPDQPVVGVSWDDAQAYCRWAGLALPTEAQWEYAVRAGTTTAFSFGDHITLEQVNYYVDPYGEGARDATVPGRSLPANPWGLYEVHGNAWEWCEDLLGSYEYLAVRRGDGLRRHTL